MFHSPPPGGGAEIKNVSDQKIINRQLQEKLERIERICNELREENDHLKQQNLQLQNENIKLCKSQEPAQVHPKIIEEFHTDEEELARETDWILKKRRPSKKRKADTSPEILPSLPISETAHQNEIKSLHINSARKEHRPPPIMITGVVNYQKLCNDIKNQVENDFYIKLENNNVHKLNLTNSLDYRKVTSLLTTANNPWHSYENKQTREIKVIVKNLHHTCDPVSIITDLKEQGFEITNAINKLKWKTKEPLNMFILSFKCEEDIKKIYEITKILGSIVKIEPLKPSRMIPQCKTCQSYGHTKNYCCKPPRCVKCAGKHATVSCTKPDTQMPKCCNCGEEHPANYRGCLVAKELQKIRDSKTKIAPTNSANRGNAFVKYTENRRSSEVQTAQTKTYADIARENIPKSRNNGNNSNDTLSQIFSLLNQQETFYKSLEKRLDRLEKLANKNKNL